MKTYIMFLLAIILLISGCETTDKTDTGAGPFIGGVGEVTIEFEDIAPPDQFNQGEDVPVKVLLTNTGEHDVVSGNAKAKIYGIDLDSFGLTNDYLTNIGILRGKGEFNKEGGEQEIDFGYLNYNQDIFNSQDFIIRGRVCYPYQTTAIIDVCIKSESSEEDNVCSITGEKVTENSVSAAPIKITSLTQDTRGSNQVRFDIKIENKGNGDVYSENLACEDIDDQILKYNNKNRLTLEVIHPLGVTCGFRTGEDSNIGEVVLDNDVDEISCWMDVENTYEDTLRLLLKYMYTDTTQKTVTIYEV